MATKSARHVFQTKAQKSADKPEPIEFEVYDEVFQAKPRLQAVQIVNFVKKSSEERPLSETFDEVILPFFKAALYQESYDRFEVLINSDDNIVEVEDFVEILQWLISQYTDRPTSGSKK